MNLRQLAYFVRIVELRNMTRAAESLYVAQPALSQQMALLEGDVETPLLVRNPRGVEPTAKGEILYRQAKTILREVDAIPGMLGREENLVVGTVSVGMSSSTARMLALPLIRAVRARYPAIDLEIVDVPSADLTLMVQQGRLDISLSPDQENSSDLVTAPLLVEELLVLAHPSVKLPEDHLTITDLADVPLILSRPPNKLRMRVDYAFMNARLPYRLLAQVSTSAITLPAISEGLGAAILPYSAAYREIHAGTIRFYPLTPSLSREISLCTSRGSLERPARKAVIELIRTLTETLIADGTWRYCKLA
jgi:LysR family nitrogen assimilation transcriptional regulator